MDLKKLFPRYVAQEELQFDYKFTIFTPVYNRSDTIERVFKSLEKQTFKDFELVIINDGSTDNSHEIITQLIKEASFPVSYINNAANKHKMACFVQAIETAKGEFILPFDSDDACTDNALKVLLNEYEQIPDSLKPKISGVTCLCKDENNNLIGKKFDKQPYYSNTFKRQLEHNEATEKWGFTKTHILKGLIINEDIFAKGYIPEGVIWELIASQGFETKYVNHVLRIYYLDSENAISIQNHKNDAFGMALYSLCIINWYYKDYFFKHPKIFIKRVFTLLRAAQFLPYKFKDYWNAINFTLLKLLFIIGWPFKSLFKNI